MVGCAYEVHEVCPVFPQKAELEERDCANQLADQRWTIQQLKRKVAQLTQLIPPAGARCSMLVRDNEQLKQSAAVHRAEVRMGPCKPCYTLFFAVIVTKGGELSSLGTRLHWNYLCAFTQAKIFRSDFEAKQRDREQVHGQMEAEKSHLVSELETLRETIQQKSRELQRKDQQLATLRGERGTSIRQSGQQMAGLQEELETARAQIRGYKTKADLLKKELEEEKSKNFWRDAL